MISGLGELLSNDYDVLWIYSVRGILNLQHNQSEAPVKPAQVHWGKYELELMVKGSQCIPN